MYIYVICVYVNILDASYRQISGKYLQLLFYIALSNNKII
jgi:hypothetical protein